MTLTAVMASDITLATTATMTLDVESSPLNAVIKGTVALNCSKYYPGGVKGMSIDGSQVIVPV